MNYADFPRVGERLYHDRLDNGLNVFVFPKRGFQKRYAFFATNYGGMDLRFCLDGVWHDTPAGVAHYLEHKMFDTPEGNALQKLTANGASPNAFTANAVTGYYFECNEKFEENLRTLLSFVSVPYFTQESVDKEQGIIGQEIGMIEDDPDWRVFSNLMSLLYAHHPIRVSVAGSVESIARITPKTLYDCHRAFYTPANMVLCAAGDFDPETVCRIAREVLPEVSGPIAQRDLGLEEPVGAGQDLLEEEMAVSGPIFQLGFKGDAPERGEAGLRQRLLGELACEVLLGNSSPLYARLYRGGLINRSFSYGYDSVPGCAFLSAGGESRDPAQVRHEIQGEAARIRREGVDPGLWERVKKGVYGGMVRSLNSFETLCISQAQSFFAGQDYLRFPELFVDIEKVDVEALLARWATPERSALSVIRPKEGGQL